ncbi:MAG TPA: succinate dehydrogenase hydrophobic membrane anchor subunit [Actinomycetota bacterium]|nr:succinate dehydrogenase hydrophobic membrane anchor subunit [Actinomycetota bacterium]
MAVGTGRPTELARPAPAPVRVGRERPPRGAEFWWWMFMRISGLALLVLAVGHVLIMHVVDEGVERVDFAFVQLRWQSVFWRTWDWLMLVLALVHGVNGLRVIALDYVRRPGWRTVVTWFFYLAGIVAFALGSVVVFTFDPCRWPGTAGVACP